MKGVSSRDPRSEECPPLPGGHGSRPGWPSSNRWWRPPPASPLSRGGGSFLCLDLERGVSAAAAARSEVALQASCPAAMPGSGPLGRWSRHPGAAAHLDGTVVARGHTHELLDVASEIVECGGGICTARR